MIIDYKSVFDIFDDDESGAISRYEIAKVMSALGEQATPAKIDELVEAVDFDHNQHIDFNEFICLMVKKLTEGNDAEEELVTVYKRFDKDGDGEIGLDDLTQMMNELGHNMDQEEARDLIFCMDKDEDGQINFLEFVQTMMYDTLDTELMNIEATGRQTKDEKKD